MQERSSPPSNPSPREGLARGCSLEILSRDERISEASLEKMSAHRIQGETKRR
jgi:hypothetical protein